MKDALHVQIRTILKGTALRKLIKTPPKIYPCCCREMHWAKECKSKFDIEGKHIPGNSKQETPPGPLQQKPGANSTFSLKSSTCGSAAMDIPALNDFLLYPQAVPSRIPTGLFWAPAPTNLQSFTWLIQFDLTDRKARGLQMEKIGCKCQTFLFLLSSRKKQTNDISSFFFRSLCKFKRKFLLKYCVAVIIDTWFHLKLTILKP